MATIKISKAQWEMIGEKAGWMKKAQVSSEQPQGTDLDAKAADAIIFELHRLNKMGGSKITLKDLFNQAQQQAGDSGAVSRAWDLLKTKGFVSIEKTPESQGDADGRNLVIITPKGQEFINKRLAGPDSSSFKDVSKQYAKSKMPIKK